MNKRYIEIDSIRGIAALSVVFGHFLGIGFEAIKKYQVWAYIDASPLSILWASHQAVIMFFILSGFVLSLPFLNDKPFSYPGYLIKRTLRIYTPYYLSLLLVLLIRLIFNYNGVYGFRRAWEDEITTESVIQHLILIGNYSSDSLNPVVWSLIHEMRISIIFPLLILMIIKLDWKKSLLIGIGFSFAATGMNFALNIQHNYFDTIHYVLMFIVGALLAKHRESVIAWVGSIKTNKKLPLFGIGILLYAYAYKIGLPGGISDWVTVTGAVILLMSGLSAGRVSSFLKHRVVAFFGDISYSVYLYHVIILFTLTNLLHGMVGNWLICLVSFVITIFVSKVSYSYIELPAIRLGRKLTQRRVTKTTLKA